MVQRHAVRHMSPLPSWFDSQRGSDKSQATMQYTDNELIELWEERAAIREYDGGMTREAAEKAAYWDVKNMLGRAVKMPEEIRDRVRKFTMELNK